MFFGDSNRALTKENDLKTMKSAFKNTNDAIVSNDGSAIIRLQDFDIDKFVLSPQNYRKYDEEIIEAKKDTQEDLDSMGVKSKRPDIAEIVKRVVSKKYTEFNEFENISSINNDSRFYIILSEYEIDSVDNISVELPKKNNGYSLYRIDLFNVKDKKYLSEDEKEELDHQYDIDDISSVYMGKVANWNTEGAVFFGDLAFAWEDNHRYQRDWTESDKSVTILNKDKMVCDVHEEHGWPLIYSHMDTMKDGSVCDWDMLFKSRDAAIFFAKKIEEELVKDYILSNEEGIENKPQENIKDISAEKAVIKKTYLKKLKLFRAIVNTWYIFGKDEAYIEFVIQPFDFTDAEFGEDYIFGETSEEFLEWIKKKSKNQGAPIFEILEDEFSVYQANYLLEKMFDEVKRELVVPFEDEKDEWILDNEIDEAYFTSYEDAKQYLIENYPDFNFDA